MKNALITGITGQDGSYMAEFLLSKGYKVFGLQRRCSTSNTFNINHILDKITLIPGDMTDQVSLENAVKLSQPDEVYNFAAQSFVKVSWDMPVHTGEVDAMGVVKLLESVKAFKPDARFLQSSTSEMFGGSKDTPQNESTPFYPKSPYGVAKLYAHWATINYRESYDLFACCSIMFNHESPRRGTQFVTQKIAKAVARIKLGLQDALVLGNLDPKRDIGHSKDYIEASWLILQQDKPDEYVIATNETHSIQEMVELCFEYQGLNWRDYVRQDPAFMRPSEVHLLQGDASKARNNLGWKPKYSFRDILKEMIDYNLGAESERTTKRHI